MSPSQGVIKTLTPPPPPLSSTPDAGVAGWGSNSNYTLWSQLCQSGPASYTSYSKVDQFETWPTISAKLQAVKLSSPQTQHLPLIISYNIITFSVSIITMEVAWQQNEVKIFNIFRTFRIKILELKFNLHPVLTLCTCFSIWNHV